MAKMWSKAVEIVDGFVRHIQGIAAAAVGSVSWEEEWEGGVDTMWDIRSSSNQRSPPFFSVGEHMWDPAEFLDAERFSAMGKGPERVQLCLDKHGECRRYRVEMWYDRWVQVSVSILKYKLGVVSDIPYEWVADEMSWLGWFHQHISVVKSMERVYAHVGKVSCPSVVMDLEYLYIYRSWFGGVGVKGVKDLAFERHMRHRTGT